MKKFLLLVFVINLVMLSSCKKDSPSKRSDEIPSNSPRTNVPADIQGMWMYGNFSTTEYWSQNPSEYIGNGLTMAMAFKFASGGTYEQYFTSSSVVGGVVTYQQAVTKGTVEINEDNQTITSHPSHTHYKRTTNGQTVEERDLRPDEMHSVKYFFEAGSEPNGTNALYLALSENDNPLTFLKK